MTPLESEPDMASIRYSNAGVNTAGRIIEVVGKAMPHGRIPRRGGCSSR